MKSLAKIALRIFSIYLIIKGIQIIPSFLLHSTYDDTIKTSTFYYTIIFIALMSACGILLWIFADFISSKIIGRDSNNNDISVNYINIQIAAFSIVGLIFILNSLPVILSSVWEIISISNIPVLEYKRVIIESVVKLIIGIWLLLGSKGIVNLINKIRNNQFNDTKTDFDLEIEDKTEIKKED